MIQKIKVHFERKLWCMDELTESLRVLFHS